MNSILFSSQVISFIRKNSPQNSRSSWVKWRGLVYQIFEFDFSRSSLNSFINEGKNLSKSNLQSIENIINHLNNIELKERENVLNLIWLYLSIEQKEHEKLNIRFQEEFWNQLIKGLKITEVEVIEINKIVNQWFEKEEDKSFFTPINISATLILVNLDFFLRWISLWMFRTEKYETWFGLSYDGAEGWFISSQFLWVPLIVISFSIIRRNRINKKTTILFEELKLEKFKLLIKNNAWNFALVFVYAFIGVFILKSIYNDIPMIVALISASLISGYYVFILNNFSIRYPHPKEVINQLEILKSSAITGELSYEENDIEIINLEVKLRSLNEQMDAFVLEAALFGALAFSGFLSIISSDIFVIEGVNSFSHNINELFTGIANFEVLDKGNALEALLSKEGLLSLLSYETLFCAIFFLSVIASRLKFNDLTDHVDRSLQLSRNFNEREEALILGNNGSTNQRKIEVFTKKIRNQLRFGALKYNEIEPIMAYMKFFRTLGISTFFIIIVTGGLFVSFEIALILMFISILSVVYFKMDMIKQNLRSFSMALQEFYFVIDKYVHYISWSIVVVAMILRSFHFLFADILLVLGFGVLFSHYILSLTIVEKEDKKEKEEGFDSTISMKQLLNRLFKIGFAVFILTFIFKTMHWTGSSPLNLIGALMLVIYFSLQPKKSGVIWGNILLSITFSFWFIAYVFKMQHYPGRNEMMVVTYLLLIGSFPLVIWKRKQIEKGIKKAYFIMLVFTVMLSFGFGTFIISKLSFNYSDYLVYIKYQKLENKILHHTDNGGYANAVTQIELDSLVYYAKEITELTNKNVDRIDNNIDNDLNYITNWAAGESVNKVVTKEALNWVNNLIKVTNEWNDYHTKVLLLIKLKRWEEAQYALQILRSQTDSNDTNAVEELTRLGLTISERDRK